MPSPYDGNAAGEEHTETRLAFPPGALAAGITRYAEGSVLSDKYRLDSLLGEGGMGAVWRATNTLLDLPVAIKLIRADLDRDAMRARLQLEARSVAKLGHPAIVRIYDVGETEKGDPFIVMELLHGQTLAQMLAQGRLSTEHAVQLLLPIIEACAVAHARGIVHRDLKPDNILVARDDHGLQPKILDFGIAKLTDPRDADLRLTEIGAIVGSPDYMSPEQARGQDDVDYRTDIWSVCVALYEAITGCVPFSASNYNALLRAIVDQEPRSLLDYSGGDTQLWDIIRKGLAKDPRDRQPSMTELGRALAAWLLSHGVQEDACGATLDSKWFGRTSDPLSLGEAQQGQQPVSKSSSQSSEDSGANVNGIGSRGPFTATIRPRTAGRWRTLHAVAAAVAVFGALSLALLWAQRHSHTTAAATAGVEDRSEHGVSRAAVSPTLKKVQVPASALGEAASAPQASTLPAVANTGEAVDTHGPARPGARARHNAMPGTKSVAGVVPRGPAAPKPSPPELDLIAPY